MGKDSPPAVQVLSADRGCVDVLNARSVLHRAKWAAKEINTS